MNRRTLSSWYLVLSLGLLAVPHIQGAGQLSDDTLGLRAAVVPDADFIIRADLESLNKAPVAETMRTLFEVRQDEAFYEAQVLFPFLAEALIALQDSLDRMSGMRPQLAATTGLTATDMVKIVVSANFSPAGVDRTRLFPPLRQIDAVVAIGLAKPLEANRLRSLIQMLVDAGGGGVLWDAQVAGTAGFEVALQDIRFCIGTSRDKQTVYIAFNNQSLAAALEREQSGQTEAPKASLSKAGTSLPEDTQVRLFLALTEPMRQRLRGVGTGQVPNTVPAAGGSLGTCFQALQTLSLGVTYDDEVKALLVSNLEGEPETKQAATIVQALAVPVLQKSVMDWTGGSPTALEAVKTEHNGTNLSLALRLTPGDLERIMNQP